jgi:hypothetical protein
LLQIKLNMVLHCFHYIKTMGVPHFEDLVPIVHPIGDKKKLGSYKTQQSEIQNYNRNLIAFYDIR